MLVDKFLIKPSRFYLVLMVLVFLASILMVFMTSLASVYKFLLLFFVVCFGVQLFWRFVLLRDRYSVIGLKKLDGGEWQIDCPVRVFNGKLRGDSTLTQWVSVLRFDVHGLRRPLVSIIWFDSLSREAFRQLRVLSSC